MIASADGSRHHHIILLPGDMDNLNWKDATAWATSIGGELPDRVESALLYATQKEQFHDDWYWTREPHASDASYAWYQSFDYGFQDYGHITRQLRARAVRRLPIESFIPLSVSDQ
jgi:hypothetical protein